MMFLNLIQQHLILYFFRSPDGNVLLTNNDDNIIRVFDTTDNAFKSDSSNGKDMVH